MYMLENTLSVVRRVRVLPGIRDKDVVEKGSKFLPLDNYYSRILLFILSIYI